MASVTPEPIFQVANGFMAAKYLFVANEVGIFEKLAEGPATLDDLALRTGVPRRTIRILADAMVGLGLVLRQGDHYQNGPAADTFLTGRSPTDLRSFMRYLNRLNYPMWMKLEEAVRTGQPLFGEFKFTEEEQQIFSEGIEALTAGQAHALAVSYDFSQHRRVLDLGGGTGSSLIAVLSEHSGLEGTLFELPAAAAIMRKRLVGSTLAGRIRVEKRAGEPRVADASCRVDLGGGKAQACVCSFQPGVFDECDPYGRLDGQRRRDQCGEEFIGRLSVGNRQTARAHQGIHVATPQIRRYRRACADQA